MEGKLYVGNLSYATTADELRQLFGQAGSVTAVELINDQASGRSKGFAFVSMSTEAEAQKAIGLFHGHALAGRDLKVNAAKPREPREPREAQPTSEPAYRSRLGAFTITDRSPNAKPGPTRPARGGGGGYQSSLGAFGKGGGPAPGRRRGGGNRGS